MANARANTCSIYFGRRVKFYFVCIYDSLKKSG
jgi:hypothetical protein